MPIFRVKSVKIYTGQKKFTRAPLVVLVTNIRYAGGQHTLQHHHKHHHHYCHYQGMDRHKCHLGKTLNPALHNIFKLPHLTKSPLPPTQPHHLSLVEVSQSQNGHPRTGT